MSDTPTITTPYRDVLPPLTTEEREALRIAIEAEGRVRNACLATEDGRLLDGHNRRDIDPKAPVAFIPGSAAWSDDECKAFMFRCNMGQRNLSPSQKSEVRRTMQAVVASLRGKGWSQEAAARAVGVAQRTVSDWESEAITISGSANSYRPPDIRVRVPPAQHAVIVERLEAGESQRQVAADYGVAQPQICKIAARVRNEREKRPTEVPAGKGSTTSDLRQLIDAGKQFGTIYADPPWKYGNQATRAATDNHYPTMTLEEIAALPVGELAGETCHLHLWTTNAFLFECPRLFNAWGFTYQGMFVWCKPKIGIGNCWRVSHEILLLAIRGEPRKFAANNLRSWAEIDRGRHSAKPERVREMIEKASPGPYLELFGRSTVPGWTVWGNQVETTLECYQEEGVEA